VGGRERVWGDGRVGEEERERRRERERERDIGSKQIEGENEKTERE